MIHINLLPTKAAKKKESVINQLAIGGLIILAQFMAVYLIGAQKDRQIAQQKVTNNNLQEEINQLSSIIAQVEEYKKKKQDRNNKIEIIKKLNDGRTGPVKMLDEFTYTLPDRMWLDTWREQNRRVEMSGIGYNGEVIADFIENLRKSKYFSDVVLVQTTSVQKDSITMQQFKITMGVNYTP